MHPQRILTDHEAEAMVAGDTFELIVERVRHMVTAGRRMALAVRDYTYLSRPPKVFAGLVLDAAGKGLQVEQRDGYVSCHFVLTDGTGHWNGEHGVHFGESVGEHSGNATERQAWDRYNGHEAEHVNHFRRRRNMTHVAICGGLAGFRYQVTDSITISAWNSDGVCAEKVLGFEPEDGSW